MKIYSSRNSRYSITDFIGRDIWVKCIYHELTGGFIDIKCDYYIRPIDYDGGLLQCNKVSASIENPIDNLLIPDFYLEDVDDIDYISVDKVDVITPLEMLDTAEIIDLINQL